MRAAGELESEEVGELGRETWKRLGSWGTGTGSWGAGGASWKRVAYQQPIWGSWGVELGS